MAVCVDCSTSYSQLKNEIHQLKSELQKRDQLIEGFVSVAAAQSKHIKTHLSMQSSTFAAPSAPSPPSLMSPVVSDSAATLLWQVTMHIGTLPSPARPEERPGEESSLLSDQEQCVEAAGTTRATAFGLDATAPLTAFQTPPVDPGAYIGNRPNAPVHSSTPKRASTSTQPSWTEVVRCRRRKVSAGLHPQPPLAISNRFTILLEDVCRS